MQRGQVPTGTCLELLLLTQKNTFFRVEKIICCEYTKNIIMLSGNLEGLKVFFCSRANNFSCNLHFC